MLQQSTSNSMFDCAFCVQLWIPVQLAVLLNIQLYTRHVTCKVWITTCLSFWANRVHSAPSLLVISGKGRSGYRARICSRRSFRKRTYPVTGALGPFGSTFFLFFPFGQPLFFGCREEEQRSHKRLLACVCFSSLLSRKLFQLHTTVVTNNLISINMQLVKCQQKGNTFFLIIIILQSKKTNKYSNVRSWKLNFV